MSKSDKLTVKEPYPLSWPVGWRRTPPAHRKWERFSRREARGASTVKADISIADGRDRLLDSLRKLGVHDSEITISSNLRTRLDGLPASGQNQPNDPGVAVYFVFRGKPRCFAADLYTRVAGNLAAIAATVEALRVTERHGVGNIEQAFAGYTAFLPATAEDWHVVLGVSKSASNEAVKDAYRALAKSHHPDAGGSHDEMAKIAAAYDHFCRERGL